MTLSTAQLEEALRAVGERLASARVAGPIRLYLVGGTAGLLNGWLAATRSTSDVDVTAVEPGESWEAVEVAVGEVARELGLPDEWLNDACRIYAFCLALGWKGRCQLVREFGPLQIWPLSRGDFIAAKVVSAPSRPQDLEDLRAIAPSGDELDFAAANLDRLAQESLDRDGSLDDARVILESLRGSRT